MGSISVVRRSRGQGQDQRPAARAERGIGELVFKHYGDQVVVSRRPVRDPDRIPTPGEAR